MKNNKAVLYALVAPLLIGGSFLNSYLSRVLPIANGYNAKILCSSYFVSKRDIDSIKNQDLKSFPYITHNIDEQNKVVTASVLGMFTRKAVYRDKLGCTLISNTNEEELKNQYDNKFLENISNVKNIDLEKSDFKNINKDNLNKTIEEAFIENKEGKKNTRAVLVLYKGKIIAEKYGEGITKDTRLLGWSMTKSVLNALTGIMIKQNKLTLNQNNLFSEWLSDDRKNITLDQLLRMSSGLGFLENYSKPSDATNMLFRSDDTSQIPLNKKLEYQPDEKWSYSSGTSNLISKLIRNTLKDDKNYLEFPYKELFSKLGMNSAIIEPDSSGNYIMSSFMYANTRDWAKFGLLYLNNGVWNNEKLFPDNWVKYTSTPTPKSEKGKYGAHFWLNAGNKTEGSKWEDLPKDIFHTSGFESQYVFIIPSKDLVIVRLGLTKDEKNFEEEKLIKGVIDSIKVNE